jgi:hypothetical protein
MVSAEPEVSGESDDVAGQDVKVGFPDPRHLTVKSKIFN